MSSDELDVIEQKLHVSPLVWIELGNGMRLTINEGTSKLTWDFCGRTRWTISTYDNLSTKKQCIIGTKASNGDIVYMAEINTDIQLIKTSTPQFYLKLKEEGDGYTLFANSAQLYINDNLGFSRKSGGRSVFYITLVNDDTKDDTRISKPIHPSTRLQVVSDYISSLMLTPVNPVKLTSPRAILVSNLIFKRCKKINMILDSMSKFLKFVRIQNAQTHTDIIDRVSEEFSIDDESSSPDNPQVDNLLPDNPRDDNLLPDNPQDNFFLYEESYVYPSTRRPKRQSDKVNIEQDIDSSRDSDDQVNFIQKRKRRIESDEESLASSDSEIDRLPAAQAVPFLETGEDEEDKFSPAQVVHVWEMGAYEEEEGLPAALDAFEDLPDPPHIESNSKKKTASNDSIFYERYLNTGEKIEIQFDSIHSAYTAGQKIGSDITKNLIFIEPPNFKSSLNQIWFMMYLIYENMTLLNFDRIYNNKELRFSWALDSEKSLQKTLFKKSPPINLNKLADEFYKCNFNKLYNTMSALQTSSINTYVENNKKFIENLRGIIEGDEKITFGESDILSSEKFIEALESLYKTKNDETLVEKYKKIDDTTSTKQKNPNLKITMEFPSDMQAGVYKLFLYHTANLYKKDIEGNLTKGDILKCKTPQYKRAQ